MKKLSLILISILLILTLAACGNKCEHTYDNACDATCNECGETREVSAHDFAAADCDTPKTCKSCGLIEGEALGHDWKAADCITAKTCTACGATEGAALGHTPADDDGDCTSHILCTVCGEITTSGKTQHMAHIDDGNCLTPITCTECETVLKPGEENHDFSGTWQSNAEGHWKECKNTDCTETDTKINHTPNGDEATETEPIKCAVCEYVITPALGHTHNYSSRKFDGTNHWDECSCEDKINVTPHVAGADDGDCMTPVKCTDCEATVIEAKDHVAGEDDGNCKTPIGCVNCGNDAVAGRIDHNDADHDYSCDNDGCQVPVNPPKDDNEGIDLPIVTVSAATNSGLKPGDTFYFTPDMTNISQTQKVIVVFKDERGEYMEVPNSDNENYPYHVMTKGDGDIWSLKIPEGAHTISNIILFDENGSRLWDYNVKKDLSEAPGIYLKYKIPTICEWLTTTYTAPDAGSAKIYGANVNLGGDIEMKYHVDLGEGVTINQVKLRTVFLGVEKFLTAAEQTDTIDGRTIYVFTLEGITPQCMGDDIDAVLYVDNKDVDSLLDYSVKQNIVNIYNDSDDEALKQLIIDTLEYGAAAQVYRNYKTSALVTADFADASTDIDGIVPENNPVLEDKSNDVSVSANVRYSSINYLLFGLTGASDYEGKVTLNDMAATGKMQDGYYTVATGAISPVDFLKDFTMKYENGAEDYVTLTYSVNDYCYAAYTKGESDAMKELALALYNYGLPAHNYKAHEGGTATCSEQAVWTICGNKYGELLDHNYTYTADQATATITERCTAGCGHEASVKLEAPQNAVYNGNEHPATLTYTGGTAFKGATPTITYNTPDGNAPVNRATYVATLQVGPHSVHVTYTILRATPEVTAPTANVLTYNGSEQALVTAGTANGGTMLYSLTGIDGSFTETIPMGTDAGDYTVYYYVQGDDNHDNTGSSVSPVEIKKAVPTYVMPTGIIVTYGKPLSEAENGLPLADNGTWSWKDQTTVVTIDAGEQTSYTAVFTPTDTKNYKPVDVEITVKVGSLDMENNRERVTVTGLDAMTYTGSAITLDNLVIKDGEKILVEEKDYTIVYENNEYVGTANVKIVFMGNYDGTIEKTFEIKKVTDSFDGEWIELKQTAN